jgi:Protein of unknown function (DUF4238)
MEQLIKQQHCLPRFYMDGFADIESNKLWVYEKGNPVIRSSSSIHEGCQKFYHAFFKDEGSKDTNTIEAYLEKIESRAKTVLAGVHNRNRFTDINKMELALFISFLLTRVPLFRIELEKIAARQRNHIGLNRAITNFGAALETFQKNMGIELNFSEYDLVEQSSDQVSLEILSHMFSIAFEIFPKLLDLKWRFLFSNRKVGYITSDNPMNFFLQVPKTTYDYDEFSKSDLDLTVPLSREVALLAKPHGMEPGYGEAHDQTVKSINKRTIMNALSRVYSDAKSDFLNKLVQEYRSTIPGIVSIRQ